jgi:hypothetical protein
MYRQLLQDSPLLVYPLIALFLFVGVFLAVVLRTYTAKEDKLRRVAALPLDEGPSSPGGI